MLVTIFVYIIGLFLSMISIVLPEYQVWPDKVFDGFSYFLDSLMSLNNIFLVIPEIFLALSFILTFLYWIGVFLIVKKIFNYFRGASGL